MTRNEAIALFTMVFCLIAVLFKVQSCDNERIKRKQEERESLKGKDRVEYDRENTTCGRVNGSRPSCWKDKDWDVFFYEYCKRVRCD